MRRDRLANDNYGYQATRHKLRQGRIAELLAEATPAARDAKRRAAPMRHRVPTIRYSPFKPIARARSFKPEPSLRDPFRNA
jgi:hypothetical protein